jgi:hypothetical protein
MLMLFVLAITVAGLLATICFGLCLLLLKVVDKPFARSSSNQKIELPPPSGSDNQIQIIRPPPP